MLKIVDKFRDLDMQALMNIYIQSCEENGRRDHRRLSACEQVLRAQEDMYEYLRCSFFDTPGAFCALWAPQGKYVSALRVEPYRDGVVLAALETAPEVRGRGCAKALVAHVLQYLSGTGIKKVYSHIDRSNAASLAVHESCGFQKILDHAVYLDGSVSQRAFTFLYQAD